MASEKAKTGYARNFREQFALRTCTLVRAIAHAEGPYGLKSGRDLSSPD